MTHQVEVATYAYTGTGSLSGDWTNQRTSYTVTRDSDVGDCSTAEETSEASWTGDSFDNDQFSQAECVSLSSYTRYINIHVRGDNGAGDDWDGYIATTDGNSGAANHSGILEILNGSDSWLTDFGYNWDSTDLIKIEIIGTAIECLHSDDGGQTWTSASNTTDSTYTSGEAGAGGWGSGGILDNFIAGNLVASVEPGVGTLTFTGYAPTATATTDIEIEVPVASLTMTGYAPTVTTTAHVDIEVPTGTMTWTGYAPTATVTEHVTVTPPVATLSFTGYAPTVVASDHQEVEVPVATLSFTGYAPTIEISDNQSVEVPVATLTFTGYAPIPTISGNQDVEVPTATLTFTGYAPSVSVDWIPPEPGRIWRQAVRQGRF